MSKSLKRGAAFLAVVASAFLTQAVMAADLGGAPRRSVKDEPYYAPAPRFSWTGLYIGAHVGYGWSDVDWQYALNPDISTNHSGSGGLVGGQIGYNFQSGRLVFGVEADISGAWLDGGTACPNPAFGCDHSFNWLGSLRGRFGTTVNGNRTLLYVTGGGAWADVDYTATDVATGTVFGTGFSQRHVGWVAGAGVEHMLTPNLTARVEYLYYGFDDATAPAGALGVGPAALGLNTQTVRFGLNYKF